MITSHHPLEYIASLLEEILLEYDVKKFLVLITDNAPNMRKATKMLETKYPHLVSFGCFAHSLHLLCQDILKSTSVANILIHTKNIIKNINGSQVLIGAFNEVKKELHSQKSLVLPVATRWGSHVASLISLVKCKQVLQRMAIDEKYLEKMDKPVRIKSLDEDYWLKVSDLINILQPTTNWITKLESDKPTIEYVSSVL
ncbi:hypothetical protein NQ314_005116 [Rhamnusium bicolor]|uniref:DUF659 domain-containing protein n=1 Tax=Rhamnusium bicolor TaxID=1586634 RepID=A0AAV8ZHT7_9CUCU|nr:hypothetical protein NQ314_005116 [Rhamnusium bicolor]